MNNMDNMDNEKIKFQIMEDFSKTIELFGLNALEARLFSYLYLSGEALTLDEMSEGLGKSKTSINTNIRNLSEVNLVQRIWRKGVRKDLYQANPTLFKAFMKFYLKKWMEVTKDQKTALESTQKKLEEREVANPSTDMGNLSNRLKEIIMFHHQIEAAYIEVMKK